MDSFELKNNKYQLIDDNAVNTMVETLNGFFTRQIINLNDQISQIFLNITSDAYLNFKSEDSCKFKSNT